MGYAYNFNPGNPYQRPPAMATQPFSPYARPAAPALYGSGLPVAPRPSLGGVVGPRLNMPFSRPMAATVFLSPQPGLPTPSQILNPAALPGSPQSGLQVGTVPTSQKPQVQNVYYTVNNSKEPATKRKNIKKFLLTTGAVVAGMFTTIGVAAGLLWFFYPGFIQLGKAIGGKNAQAAAKALSEWKKPGDFLTRFNNARKAFAQCKHQDVEQQNNSPYQRLRNWLRSLSMTQEEKRQIEAAQKAKQSAVQNSHMNQPNGLGLSNFLKSMNEEDKKAIPEFLKLLGINQESLDPGKVVADAIHHLPEETRNSILSQIVSSTSGSNKLNHGEIIATVINKLDEEPRKELLEMITASNSSGTELNYGKILATAFNGIDATKLETVLTQFLPADLAKVLSKAQAEGKTSELIDGIKTLLTPKQKEAFDKYLRSTASHAVWDNTAGAVGRGVKGFFRRSASKEAPQEASKAQQEALNMSKTTKAKPEAMAEKEVKVKSEVESEADEFYDAAESLTESA